MRKLFAALLLLSSVAFAQTTCINCGGSGVGGTGLAQSVDNSIFTSSVDASGNPNFLTAATLTLTVNGGTTPLVMFINGTQHLLASNVSPAALAANTVYFVFAKQSSSPSAMVAGDFVTSNTAPFYQYAAPTCPSPGTALSATNPNFWFDLSTNTMKACTANAGSYSASPAILLGTVVTTASAIQAVLPEPYRLTPQKRFENFGDGSTGVLNSTGAATVDGARLYQSFTCSGCTITPTAVTANTGLPLVVVSQTPVIITNTGTVNANGKGRLGGVGTATTCAAGSAAGYGGGGGGGGGGTGNAGCGGGQRLSVAASQLLGGQGGGGTAGSGTGGAGSSAVATGTYTTPGNFAAFLNGSGASGGSGGGDATFLGGNGGAGGAVIAIRAPSILIDTGSSIAANGSNGAAGSGGNTGGGGGGGGGTVILQYGFLTNSGTATVSGGAAGPVTGTGGAGNTGGTGILLSTRLF